MEALGGRRGLLVVDRKLESRAKAGIKNGLQAHSLASECAMFNTSAMTSTIQHKIGCVGGTCKFIGLPTHYSGDST